MSNSLNTPVEIDTAIAEQMMARSKARNAVERQERFLNAEDAYTRHHFDAEAYAEALEALDRETAKLDELKALYTGWSRYYHVTNVNGHIHTSMNCSTCNRWGSDPTEFAWRTDLSGKTPEEVVALEAYNACTTCMPIAPAEQKAARERYNAEQRAAKQSERQAKADEKARKAAERAVKLMVKVEAAYESLGGVEAVAALPSHGEGSLYHAVYGFGNYTGRKPLQATVADVLLADDTERREGRRASYDKDPRKVIQEAKDKGLI